MIGIIISSITGLLCAKEIAENTYDDEKRKQEAISKGNFFYINHKCVMCSVKTNNPIVDYQDGNKHIWRDVKTKEIYHVLEQRDREQEGLERRFEDVKRGNDFLKQHAIKAGKKRYIYTELVPIDKKKKHFIEKNYSVTIDYPEDGSEKIKIPEGMEYLYR